MRREARQAPLRGEEESELSNRVGVVCKTRVEGTKQADPGPDPLIRWIISLAAYRPFFAPSTIAESTSDTRQVPGEHSRRWVLLLEAIDLQPCRRRGPSPEQSPVIAMAILPTKTPAGPSDPLTPCPQKKM